VKWMAKWMLWKPCSPVWWWAWVSFAAWYKEWN